MKRFHSILLLAALCALPGFTEETTPGSASYENSSMLQPQDERAAQNALPMAKDPMWGTLGAAKVTFDNEQGLYDAVLPEAIKKLDGQRMKISGFIVPLESEEEFTHFLLSKRTPTCFFCPPGEPNEVIEIFADEPTEWVEELVTYEGVFKLTQDREKGIFFKISGAARK